MGIDWNLAEADCPSELQLDQLHYGELDGEADKEVRAHADACEHCQRALAERAAGFEALPDANPARMLAHIKAGVRRQESQPSLLDRVRTWLMSTGRPVLALAATAAVALIVVANLPPADDAVRVKGDLKLSVFRERAGTVTELADRAHLTAQDRLRFVVRLPEGDGQIMVVGVEASGKLFAYHPAAGDRSTKPAADTQGALAGAFELDDSKGVESIHLVWCKSAFSLGDIGVSGQSLSVPNECRTTGLGIVKD